MAIEQKAMDEMAAGEIAIQLTDAECKALHELSIMTDLPQSRVMVQALRCYQSIVVSKCQPQKSLDCPVSTLRVDQGMTLRQWYAGMALSGLLSHPDETDKAEIIARKAIDLADEMVKRL